MARRWMCFAIAAALGACGTEDDQRPATLEVVTLTVLAPNCGQVQCHSTSTRTEGYAFDTVEAARESLKDLGIVDSVPRTLTRNDFTAVLTGGETRMPPDTPLADEDVALIYRWLRAGAPGLQ